MSEKPTTQTFAGSLRSLARALEQHRLGTAGTNIVEQR